METFGKYRSGQQLGNMGEWNYCFHGAHCGFKNSTTGQQVEVYLVAAGLEFGELDPYFFTKFIKTTERYQPLPVGIYEDYHDGCRILDRMVVLGRFEKAELLAGDGECIVVKDRVAGTLPPHFL